MKLEHTEATPKFNGTTPKLTTIVDPDESQMAISDLLHIIFVIPMIVNDVNLSIAFRGVTVA
jgi:hypothetical protein